VAATWPPNERQIKAKIYLEQTLPVIPVRAEDASPDSMTTIGGMVVRACRLMSTIADAHRGMTSSG
jgi:hypothetical protein